MRTTSACMVLAAAWITACGDDAGGTTGSGGEGTGTGGDGGATSTSAPAAPVAVSAATTAQVTTATSAGTGGAPTSTSSGEGGTGPSSGSGGTGGGASFEEACEDLCDAQNAVLEEAGCRAERCTELCRFYDRPACEDLGAALMACEAAGEIACSCDEDSVTCEYVNDCDDAYGDYLGCEGECVATGTGTAEAARAAFLEHCDALVALAEAGGCAGAVDCPALADSMLVAAEGCEAEAEARFACSAAALTAIDPGTCRCDGGSLSCDGYSDEALDPGVCDAELEALHDCWSC